MALIKHLRFQERINNSETPDATLIVFVPDTATRNLICHVDSLTFVITGLKALGYNFSEKRKRSIHVVLVVYINYTELEEMQGGTTLQQH